MAIELAYSLHLGSDKNKKPSSKKIAKGNTSGTTSQTKNSIQTAHDLSKANKHNLRKYDNDSEKIVILQGTNDLYKDVQELYLREFEESRIEYNNKQIAGGHSERIVKNYFDKIASDNSHDLACEIIIELGDKDFWKGKDDTYRKAMTNVFKEQIRDLTDLVPPFKIANAVVHFDETSPHLHIVGVPVTSKNKRGMSKQVAKSKIFTKESLVTIQDEMRKYCIKSFNKYYENGLSLKEKQKGRNNDVAVKDMAEYKEVKRNFEQKQKRQEYANKKIDTLNEKGKDIEEKLKILKPTALNKNKYTISKEDVQIIREYIKASQDTSKVVKNANKLNSLIDKVEYENGNMFSRNFSLSEELKEAKEEIEILKDKLDAKDSIIEKLENEVEKFRGLYEKFKNFWKDIIKKFQSKIGYDNDKSYKEVAKSLYDSNVITTRENEMMINPAKEVITMEELNNRAKKKGAR